MTTQDQNNAQQGAFGVRLERTLGITKKVAPAMPGWTGETRVRYTDFQVHEITRDGTVLHLKETRLPDRLLPAPSSSDATGTQTPGQPQSPREGDGQDARKTDGKSEPTGDKPEEAPAEAPEVAEEDIKTLSDLTSEPFAHELVAIYRAAATKQPLPQPARSPPIEDKDLRGQVHQHVRRVFRSLIETSADTSESKAPGAAAAIVAKGHHPRAQGRDRRGGNKNNNNRRGNGNRDKGGAVNAPGEGEYLHFTLYKENRDTMDAIRQLSTLLRTKPQNFTTAGTKDRRAATTQRCAVRWIKAQNLVGANARLHGVVTGDYRYEAKPLHLGALQGNEFVITLKSCQRDGEEGDSKEGDGGAAAREAEIRACATKALDSMSSRGWLNYYGHQRFGTYAVGTHEVGRSILNADYEGAVASILAHDESIARRAEAGEEPREAHLRDELNRHRACSLFQGGGSAAEAQKYLPRRFTGEAAVIRHLGRSPATRRDFQGALLGIPRQLRNMYLHAYQSYVWNHAVSERWARHGDKVVEGDLILDEAPAAAAAAPAGTSSSGEGEVDAAGEPVVHPADDNDDDDSGSDADEPSTARALTAEEAASGAFTVHDVVLPTPGHSVVYPANDVGAFYVDFMGRPENGALDPHSMQRSHRDFSLPGNYRKIMARFLGKPELQVRRYAREDEQMHPTDLDRVKETKKAELSERTAKRKRDDDQQQQQEQQEQQPEDEGTKGGERKKPKIEEEAEKGSKTDGQTPSEGMMPADVHAEGTKSAEIVQAEDPNQKVAVVVRFQLAKSAYATVALRELMGTPRDQLKDKLQHDGDGAAP